MDAFRVRDAVVSQYRGYVSSFLNIRDERIARFVEESFERGDLWPDARLQLNPAYEPGPTLEELAAQGVVDPRTAAFFRRPDGRPLRLYRHQYEAILLAQRRQPYLVTTGTGSGKSLTYLVPIYDRVVRTNPERARVRAIIVYPMNALINSQYDALREYASRFPDSPVTFEKYTGQEKEEERQRILDNRPHILLTNYVMLEYILLRPRERVFVDAVLSDIEFLVLDELHTYRGRQGADVAMLVRRLRERSGHPDLLCIGTSATMATGTTRDERRRAAAEVATKLFGVPVPPENVVDETLRRVTSAPPPATPEELRAAVLAPPPGPDLEEFTRHPLAAWVEMTFGLGDEDGRLVRRAPITFAEGVRRLAEETGLPEETCAARLREILFVGNRVRTPDGDPALAFRLHQFLGVGATLYATLEPSTDRYLTLEGARYAPDGKRRLYPLAFCRECGQEYYLVERVKGGESSEEIVPRPPMPLRGAPEDEGQAGYLLLDEDGVWDESRLDELPEHWFEYSKDKRKLKATYRSHVPERVFVTPDGVERPEGAGLPAWFLRELFLFCPRCNISYDKREQEFRKLTRLSQAGRSTATTLPTVSAVLAMRDDPGVAASARKVLSFTDSRQDAALQAGHFNDFVRVSLVRAALYRALSEVDYLDYSTVAAEVHRALGLPVEAYAKHPVDSGPGRVRADGAMRMLLDYLVYEDMRRGWRVAHPNLEQCGLVRVVYPGLSDLCRNESLWAGHPVLRDASPEARERALTALLEHMRRELAIGVRALDPEHQEVLRRRVEAELSEGWRLEDVDLAVSRFFVLPEAVPADAREKSLSLRARVGRFLASPDTWGVDFRFSGSDYVELVNFLVELLRGQFLQVVQAPASRARAVQLLPGSFRWVLGDGTPPGPDPVRTRWAPSPFVTELQRRANQFFTALYREVATRLVGMEGREHTAHVKADLRRDRENSFREGALAALFCSPTMELGVDIRDLHVVHMRNVPPTPANYAQRSGRAGRGGEPALVIALCSEGSPHDQWFFRRQDRMVSGSVAPARIDLGNEDLVRAHVHSVWLAATGISLGRSVGDVLDLEDPALPLRPEVAAKVVLPEQEAAVVLASCRRVLASCGADLEGAPWYVEGWLERVLERAPVEFDRGFDRWRELYRQAVAQREEAHRVLGLHAPDRKAQKWKKRAEQRYAEALRQLKLLMNETEDWAESDFYPYRYLAAEGFLPGYNFPRLPVRLLVPYREETCVVQRPRFLALEEFGPRNRVYFEGRKYRVVRCLLPPEGVGERLYEAKVCRTCGCIHYRDRLSADVCDSCGERLDGEGVLYLDNLFELPAVYARPADPITSDEEDRLREGYEVATYYRFAPGPDSRLLLGRAEVRGRDGSVLLEVTVAPQAELLRVNHGWRRAKSPGFALNAVTGYWGRRPDEEGAEEDEASADTVIVRPFVRDTRNLLFVRPASVPAGAGSEAFLASLGYALQRGIQALFQVEESEIAVDRVGCGSRRSILFWEAAEGGTGIWTRILEDPGSLAEVARAALAVCHFDPETGRDLGEETCGRACYDCLLSYTNQVDHELLDRRLVRDLLFELARATLVRVGSARSREDQYAFLRERLDPASSLEREFLDFLYRTGRRLPDRTQYRPERDVYAEADFFYESPGRGVCVFCDGPAHDDPARREEDSRQRALLEDLGYIVVVIRYDLDVEEQVSRYADIFGQGLEREE